MNPAIIFEHENGTAIIARVTPESVSTFIESPKKFKKLLTSIAKIIDYELEWEQHRALPIGDELAGKWMLASQVGYEETNPPFSWEFDERMKNAMSSEIHSLVIFPYIFGSSNGESVDSAKAEITRVLDKVLGANSIVSFEEIKVRDALDDILDMI